MSQSKQNHVSPQKILYLLADRIAPIHQSVRNHPPVVKQMHRAIQLGNHEQRSGGLLDARGGGGRRPFREDSLPNGAGAPGPARSSGLKPYCTQHQQQLT
jgi:hypothetical protein